jgi:hypothetical protein
VDERKPVALTIFQVVSRPPSPDLVTARQLRCSPDRIAVGLSLAAIWFRFENREDYFNFLWRCLVAWRARLVVAAKPAGGCRYQIQCLRARRSKLQLDGHGRPAAVLFHPASLNADHAYLRRYRCQRSRRKSGQQRGYDFTRKWAAHLRHGEIERHFDQLSDRVWEKLSIAADDRSRSSDLVGVANRHHWKRDSYDPE